MKSREKRLSLRSSHEHRSNRGLLDGGPNPLLPPGSPMRLSDGKLDAGLRTRERPLSWPAHRNATVCDGFRIESVARRYGSRTDALDPEQLPRSLESDRQDRHTLALDPPEETTPAIVVTARGCTAGGARSAHDRRAPRSHGRTGLVTESSASGAPASRRTLVGPPGSDGDIPRVVRWNARCPTSLPISSPLGRSTGSDLQTTISHGGGTEGTSPLSVTRKPCR